MLQALKFLQILSGGYWVILFPATPWGIWLAMGWWLNDSDLREAIYIGFISTVLVFMVVTELINKLDPVKPVLLSKPAQTDNKELLGELDAGEDLVDQIDNTPPNNGLADQRLNDRNYVLWLVRKDASNLPLVPEKYRSDKTIVLAAMNSDPALVFLASGSLKKNKDFVKACWSRCPSRGIYERLRKELEGAYQPSFRDAVLETLKSKNRETFLSNHVFILKDNPELCDDREIITAALKHDPRNIRFVSTRLREDSGIVDKDMVLAAVKDREKDWLIREGEDYGPYYRSYYEGFVPERLKSDEDILKAIEEEAWHCVDEWGVF